MQTSDDEWDDFENLGKNRTKISVASNSKIGNRYDNANSKDANSQSRAPDRQFDNIGTFGQSKTGSSHQIPKSNNDKVRVGKEIQTGDDNDSWDGEKKEDLLCGANSKSNINFENVITNFNSGVKKMYGLFY